MLFIEHPARLLGAVLVCSALAADAQFVIQIGQGTLVNPAFQPPSPYANQQAGSRSQLLFMASELQAAGMSAGTISAVAFDVQQPTGSSLAGYTVRMGSTSASALTTTWETELQDVYGPQDFADAAGWNTHAFSTPFAWDGTSNIVIETCYSGSSTSQNARVYQMQTGFMSWMTRNSPNPAICTDAGGNHQGWQQRPNTRFTWSPPEAPPVAAFHPSALFSCTGSIAFADQSTFQPTEWAWDFGDGGSSTEQHPQHTYASSGSFTVTLTATNAFGSSSASALVVVDLSAATPAASCDAPSSGDVAGFGILDASIAGIAHPSGDALSESYLDNTCQAIGVVQGLPMHLAISTGTIAGHAVRAWADWDGNGQFTPNELVLSGTGPLAIGDPVVPTDALVGVPLRLRAIAAYALVTPNPQPCGAVPYGQAEDYSIMVSLNTSPPVASFNASPAFSCDGTVQFTDSSLGAPTGWTWDFGDGSGSNAQHPQHAYTASGTYAVTLTATNANGQDDTLMVDAVVVDLAGATQPAACSPATQAYCCGYGILGFAFAGIDSHSADASEGYRDRTCGNTAHVTEGGSYGWTVTTADDTPQDIRIWIDLNGDGAFAASEQVAFAPNAVSPNGSFIMPAAGQFGAPLRLRVQSDVIGQSSGPCDAPLYGQTEDFSVVVAQNTAAPEALFGASPTRTCDGIVHFTDLSTNLPLAWQWDFGDGGTSTDQDPTHAYIATGTYTVTLTATNAFGSGTHSITDLVEVLPAWTCDTLRLPVQADAINEACQGILTDDGGPSGNYLAGTSGAYTIAPAGAAQVTVQFSTFQWGNNPNRRLAIYDGSDTSSPLIGAFNGNGLAQLPNNGVITASGPSITLRQEQTGGGGPPPNTAGFLLTWNCSLTGVAETASHDVLRVWPNPASGEFSVELTTGDADRRLLLRDALGRVVEQRKPGPGAGIQRFDTEGLAPGAYLLQELNGHGAYAQTIIIR
jgi:PKD repeat protein